MFSNGCSYIASIYGANARIDCKNTQQLRLFAFARTGQHHHRSTAGAAPALPLFPLGGIRRRVKLEIAQHTRHARAPSWRKRLASASD